ncbi:MAG: T9SS type A sorting domain-containing protein [Bacteroidia bacterium]|nr:T9SS type A sorting domain-containing protein [Bacteroidia bacterium]
MKKQYLIFTLLFSFLATASLAQKRYIDPIYSDADIEVTSDVKYATNISFLLSKTSNQAQVIADLTAIKTALATGQPIPKAYFDPRDASSDIKVENLEMDVYRAKSDVDSKTDRPVVIYLHTGNFLPPVINGSPCGVKTDSSAIVLCTEWAKRGYVAVSMEYRGGWNPLAGTEEARKGQLLNAVYRAIHDVKQGVSVIRTEAAGSNTYGMDASNITLYGEGTGGYVALGYLTLDKYTEMELPKFINPISNKSYIDTAQVGLIDGSRGLLNLYQSPKTDVTVQAVVNAGGALADTSWLNAGDAPMITFQAVRDPFAPFNEGIVVVPVTNGNVVEVQGGNLFIQKANAIGNNDAIKNMPADDEYNKKARSHYGNTIDYIYPAPGDKMTINNDVEGLFPIIRPITDDLYNNRSGPWQWWDPESPYATAEVSPDDLPGVTVHMASLPGNPDMGPEKGRTFIDTIMGYMCPRIAVINGDYTVDQLSVDDKLPSNAANIYPNPAKNEITISVDNQFNVQSIRLMDITGREVKNITANNIVRINVSDLQTGYYMINIQTSEGLISSKLIKE